jgi:uncharacterized phage infection (PIP) family protein YhgE
MTRPQQRDHIQQLLAQAVTATQSLLDSISAAVENQEPYFSHTERFQTLEQTQAQLEEALESLESAMESLRGCEFPAMMPRRTATVVK